MYKASKDEGDQRWLDVVRSDCADIGLTVPGTIHLAQDRDTWRRSIAKLPLRAPAGASLRHYSQVKSSSCKLSVSWCLNTALFRN